MVFAKLSDEEVSIIRTYICEHGVYSGERLRELAPTSEILAEWNRAKSEYLLKLMGDKLIVEKDFCITRGPSAIKQDFFDKRYKSTEMTSFFDAYHRWKNSNYPWDIFRTKSNEEYVVDILTDSDIIVTNAFPEWAWQYLPVTFTFTNGNKVTVDKNSRPIRVLGKIFKNIDKMEIFEAFRIAHSQLLNQKHLYGSLCLSIHPMDYLTMSDNNCGWSSCMSWVDGGSYRAGTIEMLNSPSVIVAYLKSDEETFENWNSKKWRLLIVADPNGIISVKSYPYYNEELTKAAVEMVRNLAEKNLGWITGPVEEFKALGAFNYCDNTYNYEMCTNGAMYNDFGTTTHWCSLPVMPQSDRRIDKTICYSGLRSCMCCGEVYTDNYRFYDEACVFCDNCFDAEDEYDRYYCDCCGQRLYDDEVCWVDDTPYCECCVNNFAVWSDYHSEYIDKDRAVRVYLAKTADAPNPETDDRYMYIHRDWAVNSWALSGWYYNIEHPRKTEDGIFYMNKEDVRPNGYSSFQFWDDKSFEEYFAV